MRRFTSLSVLLAGGALLAAEARVTFTNDVQPILAKHCQSCHSPGQVAPMSLLTYRATRPWAAKIKDMVSAKKMPPVIGTPHYTVLTRGEGLTQAEINTLVKWVDDGAVEGTAGDAKGAPAGKGQKK
jgi:hypothetical protein